MPATEKTWYDQKLMHVLFAVSGVVLLASTLWMFADDHRREWKHYQSTFRDVEYTMTVWSQLQEETTEKSAEHKRLMMILQDEQAKKPAPSAIRAFNAELRKDAERRKQEESEWKSEQRKIDDLYRNIENAAADSEQDKSKQQIIAARSRLISALMEVVSRAKYREDYLLGKRKFQAADYDVKKSKLDIKVRDNAAQEEEAAAQQNIDQEKANLDQLTEAYQLASSHRVKLQEIVDQITAGEKNALKNVEENQAELDRLVKTAGTIRDSWGKWFLELPIFDAFNSPLKIDNLWTKNLTHPYYNFKDVLRYDRCTTCHRALQKTVKGTAVDPLYRPERILALEIETPDQQPKLPERAEDQLEQVYGFKLAKQGLLNRGDVTINFVRPDSPAARARRTGQAEEPESLTGEQLRLAAAAGMPVSTAAGSPGLSVADVLVEINGDKILSETQVRRQLLQSVQWGQPVKLKVRRGMPNPYVSHPRLDLYVGSTSPHQLEVMGCTVCHEGQGSATAFKWASHTPDDLKTSARWTKDHKWFNNHHWIYPMHSRRFMESTCLKCHHNVAELERSERFPDPPAPKLTAGYHLVRRYGCFGCHEINGYDGPHRRIGPDLRLEPNYYAAALQIKTDKGLHDEERHWIEQLVQHPERDDIRKRLRQTVLEDSQAESPRLSESSHKLVSVLGDVETPGTMSKVGPSLRFVGQKLDKEFMLDWIREPKHFRPTTRMPQFFGQWTHLDGKGKETAQRLEPVEIEAVVQYLLHYSQPFEHLPSKTAQQQASAERGRKLFDLKGCLACHTHKDFPDAQQSQGPDLSGIGDKLSTEKGPKWLYSWLQSPSRYHARTLMPQVDLEPLPGDEGTDPIADIVAYLLSSKTGYQSASPKEKNGEQAIDDLAMEHLSKVFFKEDAQRYLKNGIDPSMRSELKGAELELVVADNHEKGKKISREQKLLYIGRKALTNYGCFACHDIPGFEDAKPIGTALADWGRKDPSKLAFEHITHYLHKGHAAGGHGHGKGHAQAGSSDWIDPFYAHKIEAHSRIGFLYQKLREPRSYDHKKAENKGYSERLRMPQFPFDHDDREAVITFVLGLIASPPASEFVYHPSPHQQAITAGRQVLKKYHCGGCHILEMEKWNIAYRPGEIAPQPTAKAPFPFLLLHWTPEQLQTSQKMDRSGLLHATLVGTGAMAAAPDDDGRPAVYDEEGDLVEDDETYDPAAVQYGFDLWEPVVLEGRPYNMGVTPLMVPARVIQKKYPARGGHLTRRLVSRAIELEKQSNPNAKGTEAWGWLPPPLVGEGRKVQTGWLNDFLLDPHPIRPSAMLRMPKFNMTSEEATQLVNYFAAVDKVDYPYQFSPRTRSGHLAAAEGRFQQRLRELAAKDSSPQRGSRFDHAMQIVTSNDFCVKCHYVGDFQPTGSPRGLAPDLANIYRRLRPEYVRSWIAHPARILPYTGMPVNIQYEPDQAHLGGVKQDLFPGSSVEQLDAVVDLLMNFDQYTKGRSRIRQLVKPTPAQTTENAAAGKLKGPPLANQ